MITGPDWAYAHLPKTGGDAVARYLTTLIPGSVSDDLASPRKHDPFWIRHESHDKQFFLLGIRQLPDWTWSLMHEFNTHPALLRLYRTSNAATVEFALSRPFADEYLLSLSQGVSITHWIRQEALLDDILQFVGECERPVNSVERHALKQVRTKRGRHRSHPFTKSEIRELNRVNPHWSRIEAEVYS